MVVALTRRHFAGLAALTGLTDVFAELERLLKADFGTDDDRYRHRETIAALIGPWFAERTLAEAAEALAGTSLLWSPYRTFGEAARASAGNPMMREIDQPGIGRYAAPGSPIRGVSGRDPAPAPKLGGDTERVLRETGLTEAEIAGLVDRKVIGAGPA
jgi:2-methylfumaryl-CoA isomerase